MTTFTESFNKADGAGLGPDITWTTVGSGWATATQQGVINLVTAAEITAYAGSADTGSDNMYAQMVIPDFGNASYGDIGLCIRATSDMQTCYCLKRVTASGGLSQWELRKYVGGVITTLLDVNLTFAFPETWRIEAQGSTISVYRNGVLLDDIVDTDIPTGHFAGLNGFRNSTASTRRVIFDSFETGSLSSGTDITRTVDDTIGLLDGAASSGTLSVVLTDSLSVTDVDEDFTLDIVENIDDSVGVTDTVTFQLHYGSLIEDEIGLSDSRGTTANAVRAVTDLVGVSDNQDISAGGLTEETDQLGLVDSVSVLVSQQIVITDLVGLDDETTEQVIIVRTIGDQVGVQDTVSLVRSRSLVVNDQLTVTDAVQLGGSISGSVLDPVSIHDNVFAVITGDDGPSRETPWLAWIPRRRWQARIVP